MHKKLNVSMVILIVGILSTSFCLGLGVFARYFNSDLFRATTEISSNWIPSITILSKARADMSTMRRAEAQVILNRGTCEKARCAADIQKARKELEADDRSYLPLVGPADERLLFDSYLRQKAIYLNLQDDILQQPRGDAEAARRFLGDSAVNYDAAMDMLDRLIDYNSAEGRASQTALQAYYEKSQRNLFLSNLVLAILVGMLMIRLVVLVVR